MKTIALFFLWIIFVGVSCNEVLRANPKATASVEVDMGKAYPQKELARYLNEGNLYRLKLFGGAKVDVKFIGAVGLGLDFTYSQHALKNLSGHYRRFTWDWFHLPIGLGFLFFNTGLSWVVTSISIPELAIKEESIRPEFVFDTGLRIGLGSNFTLKAGGRFSRTWIDTEETIKQDRLRITGDFLSYFAGIGLYF